MRFSSVFLTLHIKDSIDGDSESNISNRPMEHRDDVEQGFEYDKLAPSFHYGLRCDNDSWHHRRPCILLVDKEQEICYPRYSRRHRARNTRRASNYHKGT